MRIGQTGSSEEKRGFYTQYKDYPLINVSSGSIVTPSDWYAVLYDSTSKVGATTKTNIKHVLPTGNSSSWTLEFTNNIF